MITIKYTLSKEDYVEYFAYMYWDDKGRKKQRIKNVCKQLLYVLLFCSVLYFTGSFGSKPKFIILAVFLIFAVSLLPLISGRSDLESQAKAIADDPENGSIFLEMLMTISDNDFQVKNKLTETKYNWVAFVNKIETKNHYYLYENAMQAIIIPKRAFKNIEEQQAFDKILSRNLSLDAELKDALH
jgi:YcxB-like protein